MKLFENWFSKNPQEESKQEKMAALSQEIKSLQENRDAVAMGMEMEAHREDADRIQKLEGRIRELQEKLEDLKNAAE